MSEIAIRNDGQVAQYEPTTATPTSLARLADWAVEARAAASLAESLCKTSFVPVHFRGKPAETAAAILTGFELGFSPMAAVRSIFVISGTPGMYAKSMVAVAQSRGHQVWIAEQSSDRVVVRGKRRGEPEIYETVWDRDRVVKAKLTGNSKYQENPQAMMVARGQAEIARQVAADALHGIPFAVEEIEDFEPSRYMAPAVAPMVTAAEILADEDPEPATGRPPAEPITQAQSKMLHTLLGKAGYGDRAAGLGYLSEQVGRTLTTSKDLTKVEASAIIDALMSPDPESNVDAQAEWPELSTAGAE